MEMDLGSFTSFLSSLRQVAGLDFAVWDQDGLVYATGPEGQPDQSDEELGRFAARIFEQADFVHQDNGDLQLFGAPILQDGQVVGVLTSGRAGRPQDHESAASGPMKAFMAHLTGLIEDWWASRQEVDDMAEQLARSFEDFNLYSRLTSEIKTLGFSRAMLEDMCRHFLDVMRVDLAFAKLPERQEYDALVGQNEAAAGLEPPKAFTESLIDSIPRNDPSIQSGFFIVNDSAADPVFKELHPEPFRFLAVTLQHEDKFYGWLGLVSFNLQEIFRRSEMRLITSMAQQLAVVITNTDLYRDLERFVINMVKSLVFAIEAKDVYTRGHSERVNNFSLELAERLGWDEQQKKVLNWAAVLHDVGKIGIPENILNKPGALDDNEYGVVKGHPQKGYVILKPLEQLSDSLPGVLHHHERYDGKGYPQGLKGEEIPMSARVIAIADTYDALTSDRAYRPGKDPEAALAIIEKVTGTQLDPELTPLFVEMIREGLSEPGQAKKSA